MAGKAYKDLYKIPIHLMFILIVLTMIFPLMMVISVSFSSETAVQNGGFSILPRDFSLDAYRLAFRNPDAIVKAYGVTAFQAIAGTIINMISVGMCAYPLSRSNFRFKGAVTKYLLLTMMIGGGTIPTYIIYTQYYHLGDTIWIYILPAVAGGAWNTFMIRTYMKGLSESLYESAEIDGASELFIFFRIALPLSVPIFAAVGFMGLVGRWSNWATSMVYIRNPDLYTLQYLLQRILNNVEFMEGLIDNPIANINISDWQPPSMTLRYAMVIIAAGPMLVVFPFFQKYFSKGLTIGSVKG